MSRARRAVALGVALLTMALTASLGLWQLDRARQKTELQQALLARGRLPTLDASALLAAQGDPAAVHHRAVRLSGQWLTRHQVFLDNRQMDGRVGFFVITPLRLLGDERVVLVQRGWVPRDFQDRTRLPAVPTPPGTVTIEGRVAPPPARLYQFGEAGTGAIRQNIDLAAFRGETGLPLLDLSVLQTGDTAEPLRRHWAMPAVDVGKHHGYAFQWFALCALVAGLTVWFQLIQPRRAHRKPHGPDAR